MWFGPWDANRAAEGSAEDEDNTSSDEEEDEEVMDADALLDALDELEAAQEGVEDDAASEVEEMELEEEESSVYAESEPSDSTESAYDST